MSMTHEDKQKLAEKIAEKAMSAKNVTYAVVLQAVYEALNARDEEIEQLRNPWISVEERMPPRDVALVFPTHSIPVIGMIDNSTDRIHTGLRYDYSSKEWCYGFTPMRKYGADNDLLISGDTLPVTHWMPIPKLKKGE